MSERSCHKCKESKPDDMFRYQRRGGSALANYCSDCRSECSGDERLKRQVKGQTTRARSLGALATLTVEQWRSVLEASQGKCYRCHTDVGIDNLTLDHMVSLRAGGAHSLENVAAACLRCNQSKNGGFVLLMEGTELRSRREGLGLDQKDLARLLSVSTNTISRWELGHMAIRGEGAIALALERLESLGIKAVKRRINGPYKQANKGHT